MKALIRLLSCILFVSFLFPRQADALIYLEDDFEDGTLTDQPEGLNWLPILPVDLGAAPPATFEAYQAPGGNWLMHLGREPGEEIPVITAGAHVADQSIPAVAGTTYSISSEFQYIDPPALGDPTQFIGVIGYGRDWDASSPDYSDGGDFYMGVVNPTMSRMVIGKQISALSEIPLGLGVANLPPDLYSKMKDSRFSLQFDIKEHSDGSVDLAMELGWYEEDPSSPGSWISMSETVSALDRFISFPDGDTPGQTIDFPTLLGGGTAGIWGLQQAQTQPPTVSHPFSGLMDNFVATSTVPEPSAVALVLIGLAAAAIRCTGRGRKGA